MSDTLNLQDLGVLALEFLEDLEREDGDATYYAAIFLVADLDEDGDVRVARRVSCENGLTNIRVLQEAQLVETQAMIDVLREASE